MPKCSSIAVAFIAIGFAWTPLLAQDAAQGRSDPVKQEKKICRSVVSTGTIMPKRYCLTKAEWARINELNDKGSAESFRNKRSIGCGQLGSAASCE